MELDKKKKTNKQIADIKKVIKSVFMLTFICYIAELCVTLRIDKKNIQLFNIKVQQTAKI